MADEAASVISAQQQERKMKIANDKTGFTGDKRGIGNTPAVADSRHRHDDLYFPYRLRRLFRSPCFMDIDFRGKRAVDADAVTVTFALVSRVVYGYSLLAFAK